MLGLAFLLGILLDKNDIVYMIYKLKSFMCHVMSFFLACFFPLRILHCQVFQHLLHMLKIIYFWIITLLSPMIFCILIEVTNSSNVLKESGPQEPATDQPIKNVHFYFIDPLQITQHNLYLKH